MELQTAKYVSMVILFLSTSLMSLVGICLQRFVLHRYGNILSITQRVISSITGGILLGTLLLLILPNCINLVQDNLGENHFWHHIHLGYVLVGLGFFLICLFKEITRVCSLYLVDSTGKQPQKNDTVHACEQHDRIIILVFALGIHYFFNGVLVGGQTQDVTTLWILLGAICFHMSLLALSVTLRLLSDNQNYVRVFIATMAWSLMGSFGVLFCLTITVDPSSSEFNLINGILQCISAGTFFYITFIDMLHNDLVQAKLYPFVNMILVFFGFSIIVITNIFHQHPQ